MTVEDLLNIVKLNKKITFDTVELWIWTSDPVVNPEYLDVIDVIRTSSDSVNSEFLQNKIYNWFIKELEGESNVLIIDI